MEFARELGTHFNRWCTALEVKTFDNNLMVLEQFKNSLPSNVAIYINERKVKTAAEAAALADEYVLTHKVDFVSHVYDVYDDIKVRSGKWSDDWAARPERLSGGQSDAEVCNYCKEKGHWEAECPALRVKNKRNRDVNVRSTALTASIRTVPSSSLSCGRVDVKAGTRGKLSDYLPFVSAGFLWLVGCPARVPVKILRDTGSLDSFVLGSVLPFSQESSNQMINAPLIPGHLRPSSPVR